MNKKKAIEREVKRHENTLKKIRFADKITKKVEPLLPDGWSSRYNLLFDNLVFSNSRIASEDNKKPSEEFKLVCKILAKMGGYEDWREAKANKKTNEITALEATFSFRIDKTDLSLGVDAIQCYPDHKCEIKWETNSYQKAIVSDECLGLGGE